MLVYGAMPRKKRPRVDTVLSVVVSVVDQITREARVVSAIVLQLETYVGGKVSIVTGRTLQSKDTDHFPSVSFKEKVVLDVIPRRSAKPQEKQMKY